MSENETKLEQQADVIASKEIRQEPKRTQFVALLSLFLIVILSFSAFYFYKQNKALVVAQQQKLASLSEAVALQSSQQAEQLRQSSQVVTSLEAQLEKVTLQLQQVNKENKIVKTDIQSLQRSFSSSTIRHPNDWILAEVEYLIALSGRKIWLEKDIKSAISLLVAADQRIVELNDASLSPLRGALLDDINMLEALPNLDTDGAILALTSLERTVDNLRSASLLMPDAAESEETEVSTDITEWDTNLIKSWNNFLDGFITVNKRDSKVEALLSPEQSWYLREHLRNNLSKAEFAIYRQQQDVYDIAIENMLSLLSSYYDLKDNTTGHFYKSIQRLSKRKVATTYPDQLKSAPLLDRVIEQRLKKSLASSNLK
jgi:uroporphyrin-3 C-methyltransferase